MGKILDCVEYANTKKEILKEEFASIKRCGYDTPKLTIVSTSPDPASKAYINGKKRVAEELGVNCDILELDETTTDEKLIYKLRELNRDVYTNAVIVQLPLGSQLSEENLLRRVRQTLSAHKDVDAFSIENMAGTFSGDGDIFPCTASGLVDLMDYYNIDIDGKDILIINRSHLVGIPLSVMLTRRSATVTVAHSKTKNLVDKMKKADIIITAVGKKDFIMGDMIKEGAVVLDVGITREDGKLYGDVNMETVLPKCSFTTSTPRGTAMCTLTALFSNLLKCYESQIYDDYND